MQAKLRLPYTLLTALLIVAAIIDGRPAYANTTSVNVNISGQLVANGSCSFNQGGAIQVNFGTVKLQSTGTTTVELDGNYLQPLGSSFTCTGDSAGLLQMKFTSSTGSYETFGGMNVLGTDKGIVAVQLLVDGSAQEMGKWFNIDQAHPPVMQAQLVQVSTDNKNNVVSGDIFTASGTLTMAFN